MNPPGTATGGPDGRAPPRRRPAEGAADAPQDQADVANPARAEDRVELASEELFPASDPPAWTPVQLGPEEDPPSGDPPQGAERDGAAREERDG